MPLLFVLVASLLGFAAIMTLVAIAAASEYGQLQRLRHDPSAQPFTLSLCDAFDPEHVLLWSSQLEALRLIASGDKTGVEYQRLEAAYRGAAARFPELYEGSSFAQWLFFLQRSEVVVLTRSRVKITPYGRNLLQHCLETTVAA
jgi:hypothetical protein